MQCGTPMRAPLSAINAPNASEGGQPVDPKSLLYQMQDESGDGDADLLCQEAEEGGIGSQSPEEGDMTVNDMEDGPTELPLDLLSYIPDIDPKCGFCTSMLDTYEELRVAIINTQEDAHEWYHKHKNISEEGRKLHEVYETKCIRLKEMASRMESLEDAIRDLVCMDKGDVAFIIRCFYVIFLLIFCLWF